MSFGSSDKSQSKCTFFIYIFIIAIFFFVAFARLFQLTIVKGSYYAMLADGNRIKEVVIEAPRGKIFDRKGTLLAENTSSDISKNNKVTNSKRIYKYSESTSHIIGYRQIADKNDLKSDSCTPKINFGAKIGKKGVEKLYECNLRGIPGKKLIEENTHGKYIKTISVLDPKPGNDIRLALDIELQEEAYRLLGNRKGAVVGLKPKTGEILILASAPGYNSQAFENGDLKKITTILSDKNKPLFNRATEGTYPPGSTFKIFVGTAGLEEGAIEKDEKIEDHGVIQAGPLKFHNWYFLEYGKTEGEVDMVKAMQRSNDTYFYILGGRLEPEKIKKWAEKFGFQNTTGFGLDEAIGIVPSAFWKKDTLGERWYLGDTYNLSIGQGYVAATPLQLTRAAAVFANGGYLCTPKILKSKSSKDSSCIKISISTPTYNIIREGMLRACQSGGTGWPFFNFTINERIEAQSQEFKTDQKPIMVGCKTGTAESHAVSGIPHAWFTVFAPYENPEIVMSVLVEEGGQGSDIAAPIAKDILKMYFERYE